MTIEKRYVDAEHRRAAVKIIDVLPDDRTDALTILIVTLASVVRSTGATEESVITSLRRALRE